MTIPTALLLALLTASPAPADGTRTPADGGPAPADGSRAVAAGAGPADASRASADGNPPAAFERFVGRPVTGVEVRAPMPRLARAAVTAVSLQRGEPYGVEAVRDSLQGLYAMGTVSDVHVRARPDGDGVHVTFIVLPAVHVHDIRFEGDSPSGKSPLRQALRVRPGDRVERDAIERQAERLQQVLSDRGYLVAEVTPEVAFSRRPDRVDRADLIFHLAAGSATRLRQLELVGDPQVPVGRLLHELGLSEGDTFRQTRLQEGLERMRELMARERYFHADVRVERQAFNATANTVDLALRVDAGPRVEMDIRGLEMDDEEIREVLPIWEENSVADWVLKASRHRLVAHLQEEGHWRPLVAFNRQRDERNRAVAVNIRVVTGPKAHVRRIAFEGNTAIPDETLAATIQTREKPLFGSARFRGQVWEEDRRAVEALYRRRGYLEARVAAAPVGYEEDLDGLRATMVIGEGPRTVVGELRLQLADGDEEPPPGVELEAWRRRLPLRQGGGFDPRAARQGADFLRSRLANAGYARAVVTSETQASEGRATVTYYIYPGSRVRVGRIVIAGVEETHPEVVRRELTFVEGAPYSPAEIIESQSRLYRLNLFSRVEIEPAVENSVSAQRTIVVRVEEGPENHISWGGGFDSEEGPRGLFGFGNNNILGMNREFNVSLRASFREERGQIVFTEPWLLGRRLRTSFSTFFESLDQESFDVERAGASVQSLLQHSDVLTSVARYNYRRVRTFNLEVDPRLLDREDREVDIGSVGYSLLRDTRDSLVDPSRGTYHTGDLQLASELFGSGADFLRFFGRSYWYWSLGEELVLAAAGRLGIEIPFGDTDTVPLPERFFTGGASSLRGFGRDDAGPLDDFGEPVGGEVLMVGNLELRFPVRGPLGGVVFLDVGNVFADLGAVGLDDVRESAGFGARYNTPIGPARVDLGFLLDRRDGEDSPRFHFSIGHTF